MLDSIGDLKLGDYSDNTIDAFGDAYEFLMTMYASNAGKSGGEFFTPQEVGELLARITLMNQKEINKWFWWFAIKIQENFKLRKYRILWSRN